MAIQPHINVYNFDFVVARFGRQRAHMFFEVIKDKHTSLQRFNGKTVLTIYQGDSLNSDPIFDLIKCLGFSEDKELRWKTYGALDFFKYVQDQKNVNPHLMNDLEEFCSYLHENCFIGSLDIYSNA